MAATVIHTGQRSPQGMSLAALETTKIGRPAVATGVVRSAEVVLDGLVNLLWPQDPCALAWSMTTLLADRRLRASSGRAGRRRYLDGLTAVAMAAGTIASLEEFHRARAPHSGGRP
jgi:hypothetical protein